MAEVATQEISKPIPRAAAEVGLPAKVIKGLVARGAIDCLRIPGAHPRVFVSQLRKVVEAALVPAREQ